MSESVCRTTTGYEIESKYCETVSICTVVVHSVENAAERDLLLTDGLYSLIEFLNTTQKSGSEAAIVDIQVDEANARDSIPNTSAFVGAVTGLVQSFTLEGGSLAPASNIIVSTAAQQPERDRTMSYLASSGGKFSRGSTYDLREA